MATIFDIKNSEMFTGFDFNQMQEGIVVENALFEKTGTIYVTLPEMFIGTDDKTARSAQTSIETSKVADSDKLKYQTEITLVNYIECYPIVLNNFTINHLKPKKGARVMVFFLNGDVKLPYYFNGHPLRIDEPIMGSANEVPPVQTVSNYYRIIKLTTPPMVGADVHQIGSRLRSMGYDVEADKDSGSYQYDQDMVDAVEMFQRRMGLTEDGEVGPVTYRTLIRYRVISPLE